MRRRINTARKGTDLEREAMRILEADRYQVHRTLRTQYRTATGWGSHGNDVFGCIDLVAKRAGERTRWIQVTSATGIGAKIDELRQVAWTAQYDSVEIWRWVENRTGVNPRTGQPLPNRCFLLYRMDNGFGHEGWDYQNPVTKKRPSAPGT